MSRPIHCRGDGAGGGQQVGDESFEVGQEHGPSSVGDRDRRRSWPSLPRTAAATHFDYVPDSPLSRA